MIDDLERSTVQSVTNPNPQFDAANWKYEAAELSDSLAAFLQQARQRFDADKFGPERTRAVLPIYMPRVSMVEAVHVMPPEPRATDAFKFTLPDRAEDLRPGGPDWERLCGNAVAAQKAKEEQMQRAAAAAAGGNGNGGAADSERQKAAAANVILNVQRMHKLRAPGKPVDFVPIILVSGGPMAVLQLANIQRFLAYGQYVPPTSEWVDEKTGETTLSERDGLQQRVVHVSPDRMLSSEPAVKFRVFQVLDDPAKVSNWDHVCACFVNGQDWEVEGWYNTRRGERPDARSIFDVRLKGFLAYFEDEKEPAAIKKWSSVVPLQLSRKTSKQHVSLRQARLFWETLFAFMETHHYFRDYTIDAVQGARLATR